MKKKNYEKLLNKKNPIDKEILRQAKKKELEIKVVVVKE